MNSYKTSRPSKSWPRSQASNFFLFCSLCMESEKWQKKQGRPGNTYHVNDVWVDVGVLVPIYKFVCNKL